MNFPVDVDLKEIWTVGFQIKRKLLQLPLNVLFLQTNTCVVWKDTMFSSVLLVLQKNKNNAEIFQNIKPQTIRRKSHSKLFEWSEFRHVNFEFGAFTTRWL